MYTQVIKMEFKFPLISQAYYDDVSTAARKLNLTKLTVAYDESAPRLNKMSEDNICFNNEKLFIIIMMCHLKFLMVIKINW